MSAQHLSLAHREHVVTSIVWATLFGWLIWNDWPMPTLIGGAAIVITLNILIIWRETLLQKRANRIIKEQ